MTIMDGMASLVIASATYRAADVTTALGIEPDWSAEKGDLRARPGSANEPIRRRFHETSMWVLEVDSTPATMMAVDDDDAKGFATLQVLADRLMGRGPTLAQMRGAYDITLHWYGTSASPQGGFVLPIQLVRDLAELGLDLIGNVYPYEPHD